MSSQFETEGADAYWEQVGGKILGELNRRLESGETDKLPGTLLMRLAEKYLQFLDRQAEKAAQEDPEYMTPLEAIDQEGLPIASKIEILTTYLDQLEADHAAAAARLEELTKEVADEAAQVHEPVTPE